MFINNILKNKNGNYEVIIDSIKYELFEETIIEFRLYSGKEIFSLEEIIGFNDKRIAYDKALRYAIKYNKNSKNVLNYLVEKKVSYETSEKIVAELIEKKIINDQMIANNIASNLARNCNGPLLIKEKLKQKLFSKDVIIEALNSISDDDFNFGKEKLIEKFEKKYLKEDSLMKSLKIKKQLYNHGYLNE